MKQLSLEILKEILKEAPDAHYHGKFLLVLIKEIERMKLLLCECSPERWLRENDTKKAKEWEKKAEKLINP